MKELDVSKYSELPFKEKGRDFDGVDCWGIIYLIYKYDLGIELPLYTEKYKNTEDGKELARLIGNEKRTWIEVKTPEIYDTILFRLKGFPMHCGLYIGSGRFIHCMEGTLTTVEKLNSIAWRNRILGYYHYTK